MSCNKKCVYYSATQKYDIFLCRRLMTCYIGKIKKKSMLRYL